MPTMTYPTTASEQTYIEVTGGVDTHKDTHTAAALDALLSANLREEHRDAAV